jgi:Flp pilus assembly protein TadD
MIVGLALALTLAGPVPSAALTSPPAPSSISLAEAGRAIAAGRLDQAKEMLGVAVAAGAKGEPVDRLLADLHMARGENEQALSYYLALIASHPDELLLLERAGIAALKIGRIGEATALLDRATRQAGAGWRAWNARGIAADRQARWDEAGAAYARAIAMDPVRAEIHNNRGWSLMLQGRWDEALAAFEGAAAINPALPRLANNLELARGAVAAALPQRKAGELDEDYAARLNDAGVVAAAAGQTQRAEAAFAQAIGLKSRWYAKAADNLAALGASK